MTAPPSGGNFDGLPGFQFDNEPTGQYKYLASRDILAKSQSDLKEAKEMRRKILI